MRLLHFNEIGNLVLTDFHGKAVPPYAILSHRWTTGEPAFEDVRNNEWETKPACRKIRFCAERALKDELKYFWIDTCCIDRWDISELSGAINQCMTGTGMHHSVMYS